MEAISFDNFAPQTAHQQQASNNWHLLPLFTLDLYQAGSADRAKVEHFIHQRFAHQYGANISVFLPMLLSAADDKGISAALGFQAAASMLTSIRPVSRRGTTWIMPRKASIGSAVCESIG